MAPSTGLSRYMSLMDICPVTTMIPPRLPETRTGIMTHLDPAIFSTQRQGKDCSMAPSLGCLYSCAFFGSLLFQLLLSNLLQAQLIAPGIRCHLLGDVPTGDTCRTHLAPHACDLEV